MCLFIMVNLSQYVFSKTICNEIKKRNMLYQENNLYLCVKRCDYE